MVESPTHNVATLNAMLSGFAYALSRLEDALRDHDAAAGFRAVFEALNWAVAIDERIKKHWTPEGSPLGWGWRARVDGAGVMAGVRFVRNRVHHQWADAFYLNETGGATFPMTFPVTFSTWRWRAVEGLPEGRDEQGRDVYEQYLAEQPVERTLTQLGLAFESVAVLLEPPRPALG